LSTLIGAEHTTVLKSKDDLAGYFQAFSKPQSNVRVGLEAEFFTVRRSTGRALSYGEPGGIHEILQALNKKYKYQPILEEDRIIALKREDEFISLEPGGQMELSAPPVSNIFEIEKQIKTFVGELRDVAAGFPDTTWLAVGIQPFTKFDEIAWVPKRRYEIMAEYFKTHGTLSHHMMKRTSTNQVSIDYISEDDAMAKLRVVLGLTSIVSALFANSSFAEGKLNGFRTERVEIWNHTDPSRAGLTEQFIRPGLKFSDYLQYLFDMPVIFVVRGGKWIPFKNINFGEFIRNGYEGLKATIGDFELHLSTAFPEARIKQYIEIRGADCQAPDLIPAIAAFWKGIIFDPVAREKAWDLVSFANEKEFLELHKAVPRQGLQAKLVGRPIFPIACELVDISCASLAKQKQKKDEDECVFLERIREKMIRPGKSPGETLLEKWEGEFNRDPSQLIDYLSIL